MAAGEQLRRVLPVINALARRTAVPISIDTSKAEVAREAIAAGAQIINNVTGLTGDPAMIEVAAEPGRRLGDAHAGDPADDAGRSAL